MMRSQRVADIWVLCPPSKDGVRLTIDASLELLPADFAGEISNTSFLVQFHRDRKLVVAKKTREIGGKGLFLSRT